MLEFYVVVKVVVCVITVIIYHIIISCISYHHYFLNSVIWHDTQTPQITCAVIFLGFCFLFDLLFQWQYAL